MRLVVMGITCLALAGCASGAQIHARQNAADDATCQSYGAKPGTDAYTACRMNAANARERRDEARVAAGLEMARIGQQMMQPPPVAAPRCIASSVLYC